MRLHALHIRDQRAGGLDAEQAAAPLDLIGDHRCGLDLVGNDKQIGQISHGIALDRQDQIAFLQRNNLGGQIARLADQRLIDRLPHEKAEGRKDEDRQDKIEHRASRHGGRARPKRRPMHRAAALLHLERIHRGPVLARGRIAIAQKLYETAKGQCCNLPARAMFIGAAEQNRAKSDGKHLGMNARPAPDDIMTIFMDRDDDRQGHHEGQDGKDDATKLWDEFHISSAP